MVERVSGGIAEEITKILVNTTRSVVFGIVGTAIGQGLVAGIGFWIAGVPGVLILSFASLRAVCHSNRPSAHLAAGSRLALWSKGELGMAAFLVLWGTLAVSSVDKFHQAALDCPRHFNADRAPSFSAYSAACSPSASSASSSGRFCLPSALRSSPAWLKRPVIALANAAEQASAAGRACGRGQRKL